MLIWSFCFCFFLKKAFFNIHSHNVLSNAGKQSSVIASLPQIAALKLVIYECVTIPHPKGKIKSNSEVIEFDDTYFFFPIELSFSELNWKKIANSVILPTS